MITQKVMEKRNTKKLAFVGVRLRGQKNFKVVDVQKEEDQRNSGKVVYAESRWMAEEVRPASL